MKTYLRKISPSIAWMLVLATACGARAATTTLTTADGGADAFVTRSPGGANNGASEVLWVGSKSGGDDNTKVRVAAMRFDVSTAADLATATAASLHLTLAAEVASEVTLHLYGVPDGLPAASTGPREEFGEDQITFQRAYNGTHDENNAAGVNGYGIGYTNTGISGGVVDLGTITVSAGSVAGTLLSFSGAELLGFLANDTNGVLSFNLAADTPDILVGFHSKENLASAAFPTLSIDYAGETPEEPEEPEEPGEDPQDVSLTTGDGAGADTYVARSPGGSNFGSSERLWLGSKSGDDDNSIIRVPMFKFDLSGVTEMDSTTAATLTLTLADTLSGAFTVHLYGVPDGLTEGREDFTESTITFQTAYNGTSDPNNAAGINGYGINYNNTGVNAGKLVDLGEVTLAATDTELNISGEALRDFLLADTNGVVSFVMGAITADTLMSFHAKENTSGGAFPTLVIQLGEKDSDPEEPETPEDVALTTAVGAGADAFVTRDPSGANYGASEVLWVGSKTGGDNNTIVRVTVMKFDLSSATSPATATFASLSLALANALSSEVTFHLYGVPDALPVAGTGPRESFDEDQITFQRAYDGTHDEFNAAGVNGYGIGYTNTGISGPVIDLGTVTLPAGSPAGTTLKFSSTALHEFLGDDTNAIISLSLAADTPDQLVSFYSKENLTAGTPPTFEYGFGEVPEEPEEPEEPGEDPTDVALTTAAGGGADTYVARSPGGTNFGASELLWAGSKSGGDDNTMVRVPVLKFDLSNVTGWAEAEAASLTLTLAETLSGEFTFHLYGIPDALAEARELFDESAITFQTAYNGTSDPNHAAGVNGYGIAYSNTGVSGSKLVDFGTVTLTASDTELVLSNTALLDFLLDDTNGVASFVIEAVTADTLVSFYAKENLSDGASPSLSIQLGDKDPEEPEEPEEPEPGVFGFFDKYQLLEDDWVDSGHFMGMVWVKYYPWVYAQDIDNWVYFVDPNFNGDPKVGGWMYTLHP